MRIKTVFPLQIFVICLVFLLGVSYSSAQESEVKQLVKKISQLPEDTSKVNALNKLAKAIAPNSPKQSLNFSKRALELATALGYKQGIADSYHYEALAYDYMNDLTMALEKYLLSLKVRGKTEKDKRYSAKTLNNLAIDYIFLEKYDLALETLDKALSIYTELKDYKSISEVYNNYSMCYRFSGDYKKALDYSKKSMELCIKIKDKQGEARCLNNIAENSLGDTLNTENKKIEIAIEYLKKSLAIYQEIQDTSGMAWNLLNIGKFYEQKNEIQIAINNYKQSLKLAKKNNDLVLQKYIFNDNYQYYLRIKDSTKALLYYQKFNAISDSINSGELRKKQEELAAIFETENKENEIKNQKLEIKSQILFRNFLFVGFALTIALVFFIYRVYRIKKRDNKLLAEKNKTISEQKEELEVKKEELEIKNKEITDSIHYATKIQKAILRLDEEVFNYISEQFILYKPRDLVSGDFYWFAEKHNKLIFAVADCTGHGVPGSLMSMLGMASLNNILNQVNLESTSEILNLLRLEIIKSLHQSGKSGESQDGMDISFCIYDKEKGKLMFSGANNAIYILRKPTLNEDGSQKLVIEEFKADRMPIGVYIKQDKSFSEITTDIFPGDTVYLTTDGFIDQFDNDDLEKFSRKRFKKLIEEVANQPLNTLEEHFNQVFLNWKGKNMQFDDVTVAALRF